MKILIIQSPYYKEICDELRLGAIEALEAENVKYDVIDVPGAFEVPAAISYALASQKEYAGFVTLGCVIRGETAHFDIVAIESARAILDLSVSQKLCVGNAILTVENRGQAMVRASRDQKNLGGEAAKVCLEMIKLKEELK